MVIREIQDAVALDGYALVPGVIDMELVLRARAACEQVLGMVQKEAKRRGGVRGVIRRSGLLAEIAASPVCVGPARDILGADPILARSILFDKTPEANWDVPWHRDTTIAVRERRAVEGFGPWSIKEDVPHVQPPLGVLESMVTLRLHLD